MGGFARYPWPQYINNAPFYYNKKFKNAVILSVVSGVINFMWIHRYIKYHHVVTILFRMSTLESEASLIQKILMLLLKSDSFDLYSNQYQLSYQLKNDPNE
jgi:hypothetical protein